mmetsp:Transcript_46397/g.143751  ORF Transcript_46397/g.143751 Transcript_46397/m.143751 type:complete len:240 (+) Transcript_46397:161-880(+)
MSCWHPKARCRASRRWRSRRPLGVWGAAPPRRPSPTAPRAKSRRAAQSSTRRPRCTLAGRSGARRLGRGTCPRPPHLSPRGPGPRASSRRSGCRGPPAGSPTAAPWSRPRPQAGSASPPGASTAPARTDSSQPRPGTPPWRRPSQKSGSHGAHASGCGYSARWGLAATAGGSPRLACSGAWGRWRRFLAARTNWTRRTGPQGRPAAPRRRGRSCSGTARHYARPSAIPSSRTLRTPPES